MHVEIEYIGERKRGIETIKETLTQEELLRFGYVPFVIARLVWDYADTILDLCAQMRLCATKKLCRAVRELRLDYDRLRHPYIDKGCEDREDRNAMMFEDGVDEHSRLYMVNLKAQVEREFPELDADYRALLYAVYQCHALLSALLVFAERQRRSAAKKLGWALKSMLPVSLWQLKGLLLEFAGDKRLGHDWEATEQAFVKTFATQMGLVKLIEPTDG